MSDASDVPQRRSGPSVARSASVVGIAVLASRVLGLVRELIFAAFFGAGTVADAFVTAFRIPNLFRDLFAEGALSAAFVKTFSQKLDQDGEPRAWRLASLVFNAVGVVVGLLIVLGMVFAPYIVDAISPGFAPEKRALAVDLTRWMFPFLLLVSLAAVSMGMLNARGIFGVPSMASSFFNVGSIVAGVGAAFLIEPGFMSDSVRAILERRPPVMDGGAAARAIVGMAVGVLAGGAMQFLCQVPSMRRTGFRYSPVLDFKDSGLRAVLTLMGPAVIGTAATQVNVFVNNNFASKIGEGAVASLYYAFRLMQFPIGVFGVAIATATLPAIARSAGRAARGEFRETLGSSLSLALFLTVPSAVGLAVLGRPIIALVYERGHFDAAATSEASAALAMYSIGLVGYSLVKILAPASYAVDDARTPALISVGSIAVNFALCAALWEPYGVRGLAFSTSVVATANAMLLLVALRRRAVALPVGAILVSLLRIGVATVPMAFAAAASARWIEDALDARSTPARAVVVFGAIAVSGAVYLLACVVLRVAEVGHVTRILRRLAARAGGR